MKNNNCINHFDDPSKYMQMVKKEWRKFIETGETSGLSVRNEILESWKLSLKNGISYSDAGANIALDDKAMSMINAENTLLISVAQPIMDEFASMLKKRGNRNNVINLCNMDTVILRTVASGNEGERHAESQRLLPGAILNEKYTGTTGVSMVRNTHQPYAIYGAEHFPQAAKTWCCAAAPIQNIGSKEFRGIISLSGENLDISPDTLGMITFVAHTIENSYYHVYSESIRSLIETYKDVLKRNDANLILAVDDSLNIIASSQNHHPIFKDTVLGRRLQSDVVKSLSAEIRHYRMLSTANGRDKSVSFKTDDYSISCTPVFNNQDLIGVLLYVYPITGDKNNDLPSNTAGRSAKRTVLVGDTSIFLDALNTAKNVAKTDASVMLSGETGVGKEGFAKTIYENSCRAHKRFVAVNCGALPKELIGSELFGYAPGAFTGALVKGSPGKIEASNGGTLFLDELESLPLDAQTYLLRVLEERELFRLGSNEPISIDLRIISSTNVDLEELIEKKLFRADLFFRLNVVEINIPPLRERFNDLSNLISHINARYTGKGCSLKQDDLAYLRQYTWPGNVRELKNVIQSAAVLEMDTVQSLKDYVQKHMEKKDISAGNPDKIVDKKNLLQTISDCNGNISKAAEKLGVARSTIYRNLKKL